jgi:hypothetical protein
LEGKQVKVNWIFLLVIVLLILCWFGVWKPMAQAKANGAQAGG